MKFFAALCSSIGLAAALTKRQNDLAPEFDPASYASEDVLYRDVAVIGGGSSGTYGAIKLLDMGQSVALVERADVLGGHENTYIIPDTGEAVDYGVQSYWNISVVRDFFARFNIPIENYNFTVASTLYTDMETGQVIGNFTPPRDYSPYQTQLSKYPELAYSWHLPSPVPEELLLPFGDFIKRYSLQSITYAIWLYSAGVGDILTQLTVNMFKWFDVAYLEGLRGGNIWTANRDNGELYVRALEELGPSALISSTVIAAHRPRDGNGVRLVVQTPTGNRLIMASQMLVSIPPLLSNMSPFDLDYNERGMFEQFTYSAYYNGLANNTGLARDTRYINIGANSTYNIPDLPGIYRISPTNVEGLFIYWYGSLTELSQEEVEAATTATFQRLTNSTQTPDYLAYNSHTPFKLVVSADEISNGFYDKWEAMQGYRNTWYTGAAFQGHSSGVLWNFTQALLPDIVRAV
jgi:hypothetical protein